MEQIKNLYGTGSWQLTDTQWTTGQYQLGGTNGATA